MSILTKIAALSIPYHNTHLLFDLHCAFWYDESAMKEYFSLNKERKKQILATLHSTLQKQPEIIFALVHGSFPNEKGNFRDIDVAVYLKKPLPSQRKFAYEQKIVDLLEQHISYPVDVRVLNGTPFYFLNNVFRLGKLLFCRDNSLLAALMEQTSIQTMANYYFSRQSLKELAFS